MPASSATMSTSYDPSKAMSDAHNSQNVPKPSADYTDNTLRRTAGDGPENVKASEYSGGGTERVKPSEYGGTGYQPSSASAARADVVDAAKEAGEAAKNATSATAAKAAAKVDKAAEKVDAKAEKAAAKVDEKAHEVKEKTEDLFNKRPDTTTTSSTPSIPIKRSPHQTPLLSFPIAVYSHRGGPMEAPGFIENTMPAFRNSAKLKVDLLELDVQLTKDGQVVVFHDKELGRIFGAPYRGKRICDYAYSELPTFSDDQHKAAQAFPLGAPDTSSRASQAKDIGANAVNALAAGAASVASKAATLVSGAAGSKEETTGVAEGTNDSAVAGPPASSPGPGDNVDKCIPLLRDVFAEFPHIPIQVDLKADTPGLVKATHDLILEQPGRKDKVLWGSFLPKVNGHLYAANPTIPLFTSSTRLLYLLATYQAGMLSYAQIHESAAIIPWRMPLGWGRNISFLNAGFFQALNARGVAVVVYGDRKDFNTQDVYRSVKNAGANAICTDAPSMLQTLLKEEGELKPVPWATQQQ